MAETQELAIVVSVRDEATAALAAIKSQLAALAPLVAQINSMSLASGAIATSMAAVGATTGATAIKIDQFSRALAESNVISQLTKNGVHVLGQEVKTVGKTAKTAGISFGGLWKTIKRFAPVLGAVQAFREFTKAIKASIQAALDFNEAMHDVWTLTDKTWTQMKSLSNEVRNFARGFNISATEATKALYQIYSSTFYGADAMKILESATKGAAAGLADVYAAADMTTTILNAYRMAASEANKVQDLLFTTVKYGKVRYEELTEQFGRLAGVAAPVGAGLSEMTAAIATLTRAGIETDWAVTSLRQTLMQMLRPTANLKLVISSLGFASGTAMMHSLGFAESLKAVTAYAKANNIEMSQMFTNVRAITAVLPLTSTLAREYAKDLDRMANSAGTMNVAFTKQTQSWSYQLKKIKTAINDSAISIGKALVPALVALLSVLEAILYPFGKAMEFFSMIGGDYLIAAVVVTGTLTTALWLLHKAWLAVAAAAIKAGTATIASTAAMGGATVSTGIMARLLGGLSGAPGGLLGGAGLLAGAGLIAGGVVKAAIDFDFTLGSVTGVEQVKRVLADSLAMSLGLAASGAIIGSMFGGIGLGTAIGAAVGATAALTIYVIHEIKRGEDEAATRAAWAKQQVESATSILPFKVEGSLAPLAEQIAKASQGAWEFDSVLSYLTNNIYDVVNGIWQLKDFTQQMADLRSTFSDMFGGLLPSIDQLNSMLDSMRKHAMDVFQVTGELLPEFYQRLALANQINKQQLEYDNILKKSNIDIGGVISSFKISISSFGKFKDNVSSGISALVSNIKKDIDRLPQDANTDALKTEIIYKVYSGLKEAGISAVIRRDFLAGFDMTEEDLVNFLISAIDKATAQAPKTINISTQFAAAKDRWASLVGELDTSNITVEHAQKVWTELSNMSSTWSEIALIAAKNGWSMAEAIAATSKEWEEYIKAIEKGNNKFVEFIGIIGAKLSSVVGGTEGALIGSAVSAGTNIATGNYMQAAMDVVDMAVTLVKDFQNKLAEAGKSLDCLIGAAWSLAQSFANLITQSDAYSALQDNLSRIAQLFRNALAALLWPLVALAESLGLLLGITDMVTTVVEAETKARLDSLNVPAGYKLMRAAWGVATPGQPWPTEQPASPPGGEEPGVEIPDWALKLIEPFAASINKIGGALKTFLDALGFMTKAISGPFLGAILAILSSFVEPLKGLSAWIKETLTPDLVAFFTSFGEWWRTDVDPFLQKKAFPQLGEWILAIYKWIKIDFLPFLKNYVWPFFTNTLWPAIVDGVNKLGHALSGLWNTITENKDTIGSVLVEFINNELKKFIGAIETASAFIQTKSGDLMGGLKTIWESESLSLWDKLKISFGLGATAVFDWFSKRLKPLWDAFGKLWDAISPVLIPALIVLGDILKNAFQIAITLAVAAIDLLTFAVKLAIWPFQTLGTIIYNLYVAINNTIQYILNLLNPFSSGNQLPYKPLPPLPGFAKGGVIPGLLGSPQLIIAHGGEQVLTPAQRSYGGGDTYVYNVTLPGVTNAKQFDEELEKIIRRKNLRKSGVRTGGYALSGA